MRSAVPILVAALLIPGLLIPGLLIPAAASANDDVDAGVAALEEGEFEAALARFAEAEGGALTRDELVRLYTHRALAQHAIGENAAMRTDLTRLASLEPRGELPRAAPPPVREAFAEAQERAMGGLTLDVRQRRRGGSVRLTVRVQHDLGALVNEVSLAARPQGSIEWIEGDPASLTLSVADGQVVEVRAQAIGPGGALLAARGTDDAPDSLTIGQVTETEATEAAVEASLTDEEGGSDDVAIGVGVGITLAVVLGAGAAVLAYFLLSDDGGARNEIAPPTTSIFGLSME